VRAGFGKKFSDISPFSRYSTVCNRKKVSKPEKKA
jgi:hypothetical protein